MSGIWGIFNRDGAPASPEALNDMQCQMALLGPDGCRNWYSGPVGFGCSLLWNTPESKFDKQPLLDVVGQGRYVMVSDTRLDNRQELVTLLGMSKSILLSELTDGELILAAYRKWGERCPEFFLGDFVFVLWDESQQSLFCARDHMGIKSLYYYLSQDRLVIANHVSGVVAHLEVPRDLNDQAVAIYLAQASLNHSEWTFFRSVRKLPPGTSLCVTPWNVNQQTYWRPEDSPQVRCKKIDDYKDQLSWLMQKSVAARIRSDYLVAAHLSGGLDSSSVAVMAARMLYNHGRGLIGFNWVHAPGPNDDPNYFEWANSRSIAALENIWHEHIEIDSVLLGQVFSTLDIAWNDTADLWYEHILRRQARRKGVRVILSGWGGDEFISYNGAASYSGIFWRGGVISALREIYHLAKQSPHPWRRFANIGYRKILLPLFPWAWGLKNTGSHYYHPNFKRLLRPGIARKVAEMDKARRLKPRIGARADQLARYRLGYLMSRIESWGASSGMEHIEYRYPLLDKRLVEFALGLPPEMYLQRGYGRFLFRWTVADILPLSIAWNDFKWEPQRVARNVEVACDAYAAWANSYLLQVKDGVARSSPYIYTERLFQLIFDLTRSKPPSMEELIDLADGIGIALLVANMGNQVRHCPQQQAIA